MPTSFDDLLQDTPAPGGSTFDSLIDEMQADDRKRRLLETRQNAKDVDPARQAEAIRVSREKGVPPDIAYESLDELKDPPGPDFDALLRDAPATADLIGDPVKGPVAFPDATPLADAERQMRELKALTDFTSKIPKEPPKPLDPVFSFGVLTPEERVLEQQRLIKSYAEEKKQADTLVEQMKGAAKDAMTFPGAAGLDAPPQGEQMVPDANLEAAPTVKAARQDQAEVAKALQTVKELAPTLTRMRNIVDTAARGTLQFPVDFLGGLSDFLDALATTAPEGTFKLDAKGTTELTRTIDEIEETISQLFPGDRARDPEFMTKFTQGLVSMAGFLTAGAVARAAGVSSAWATAITGALTGAREGASDAKANNATPYQKALATLAGAVAGTSEVIPVENWFQWAETAGGPWLARLLMSGLSNAGTEGLQELAQGIPVDLVARYTYDPARDILTNMRENFTVGGAVGGFFGLLAGIRSPRPRETADKLKAFGDTVGKTQTSQIMPELLEEQIANLKKMGAAPEQVTVSVEAVQTLFQELSPDDVRTLYPDIAAQIVTAQETGAEVTIPTERLPALANLKGYKTFTDYVRVSPDEMTVIEQEETKKEIEAFLKEVDTSQELKSPDQSPVYQNIRQQLIAAGQSPEAAHAQARLYDSVFTNLSERTGVPVDTLVRRYGFEVASSEVGSLGVKLEQKRRFYHGTNASFTEFKVGLTPDDHVPGVSLTDSPREANAYGQNVVAVEADVNKPMDYANLDAWALEKAKQKGFDIPDPTDFAAFDVPPETLKQWLQEDGYDAIDYRGDPMLGYGLRVLDPKQLRIVADPQNPNILFQLEDVPAGVQKAVDTAALDNANTVSKSKTWAKGRDLKDAIQKQVVAALDKLNIDPSKPSPQAIQYLTAVGLKDGLAALEQNPNAIGWYDTKTRQALAVMALVHPEIAKDENARFAFTWALAVTSNGIKVGKNFQLADEVYNRFKTDGKMPTDVKAGNAQAAINASLQLFNDLRDRWGIDNLRRFMLTDFTVSEITGIDKDLKPSGEAADELVRGAAILGPKIGNGFFSNLYGNFDALTMDRWLVRTWGRWTGTLIEVDQPNIDKSRQRLSGAVKGLDREALAASFAELKKKLGDRKALLEALAGDDIDAISAAVQKASMDPETRAAMNEAPGGEELRKAGNSLAKYLDGQKEQPAGPKERQYIRQVFNNILAELKQDPRYSGLTMADLQAVLWYAEKRLYETAKEDVSAADVADGAVSGYEDEEAPDYANAAAARAREVGVSDRKINAALQREANNGRAEAARSGADRSGGADGEAVTGGEGGEPAAARGFTRDQKRAFIQREAIERIRSNRGGDEAASWSYSGAGGEGRGGVRLLKKLGVGYIAEWKAGQKLATVFRANDIKTPTIYELEPGSAKNVAQFVSAISDARKSLGAIGEAVYVYPEADYAGMRLFLTEDGKGGFALKPDGDIVSVFSAKGTGAGRALMETAVAAGGKKLDAFDTILPDFYSAHGFRGVSRLAWADDQAPPNWDKKALARYNGGEPDVVFMVYDPAYFGGYDQKATPLKTGDNAYDRALKAQEKAVKAADQTRLNQDAKGFITFSPARDKFKVTLTGKADLSTFLHESGHFFLEVVQDLVARGEASAQQVADLDTLRQWMGAEPNKPFEVKQHEQFARGFEAYLMEGKAPSMALARIFQTFKAWLIFVYRRLSGLNVQLTDEVRGVLDRLVASDEAIAEARAQVGWRGKPMAQEATGLTDAEYKTYVEAWLKANDAQSMDADARVMMEAAREIRKAWRDEKIKLTKEAEAELAKTQGYRAWKMLESGEGLDKVRPGWSNLKIDEATVPKEWKRDAQGLTGKAIDSALPLDDVAEILGFSSGETMLSHIAGAKAAQKAIPLKVRAQMQEIHGSMDDAAIAQEAAKAVHNKPTMDVLLTEYRALASQANMAVQKNTMAFLNAQAEDQVAQQTQRQIDPVKWRRAELKAAEKAGKLAGQGKKAEAALAKRQQLMAAAMARASLNALDRIEKIKDYLSTFQTDRRRAQLGKAGDLYLDGIDQILEGVEFKDRSLKALDKRKTLQEVVNAAIAADEPVNIPPEILDTAKLKNYSQMTVQELEGIHDAVKNLWTLAKLKNTLKARQQKLQLDRTIDQIDEAARARLPEIRKSDTLNPSAIDRAFNAVRWVRSQLVKMEFLTGWIDGQPDGGLFHQVFYQPIADARAAEYKLMKEMSRDIIDRIRDMPADQRQRWDTKRTFMGQPMKGANIIAAALNLGNEGNKTKLLQGYGWNEAQFMDELNAFMTKADWDMVQHIWNTIDKLWPKIEAVSKAATGLPPERVVPSSVMTPYGEYAGGYYPVVYDPFLTQRQAENQEKNASANGLFQNNFLKPSLANGFTKKRTGYTAPIRLSLDVLSGHLAETIHYVTHYEAVKQADKIRSHPKFRQLMFDTFGKEFYDQIRPWLQDIANNATQRHYPELGEVVMRHIRTGTSISAMGYNLGTGVKQLFGITTALDAVGPRYWAQGVFKTWFSPGAVKNWRFALENSQELEPLIRDFDRDIKQVNDAYATKLTGNAKDFLIRNAFAHIGYLQLVVNVATWQGAYEQAIAEGRDHRKAVDHADSVVRKTQSSGAVKDLANVQRSGEASKLLTMFYSYMSIVYNRLEDISKNTNSIKDVPHAAVRLAILATLPALLEMGYQAAYDTLTGGDDDEEDDGTPFLVQLMLESANTVIGSVPVLRNVIDLKGYGAEIPAQRALDQFTRTAAAFRDIALEGEAPSRSEIRAAVTVFSTLTHTPGAAIYKLADDLLNGQITPNNR